MKQTLTSVFLFYCFSSFGQLGDELFPSEKMRINKVRSVTEILCYHLDDLKKDTCESSIVRYFDENGNLVQTSLCMTGTSANNWVTFFKYNTKNKLLFDSSIRCNGKFDSKNIYQYDSLNRISSITSINKISKPEIKIQKYKYSHDSVFVFDNNRTLLCTEILNKQKQILLINFSLNPGQRKYSYDDKGNLIEIIFDEAIDSYDYDKKGLATKEEHQVGNSVTSKSTFNYQYY